MSQHVLQQTLISRTLSASSAGTQSEYLRSQVTEFLNSTVEEGGNSGKMAQDLLQLMQHAPDVTDEIAQQLASVLQLMHPRKTLVVQALDDICVGYWQQIAELPDIHETTARQAAGGELAKVLRQAMCAAQTPENRVLLRLLQQGKVPADNASQAQLEKLCTQVQLEDGVTALPQLIRQFAKTAPELRTVLQKSLSTHGETKSEMKEACGMNNSEQATTVQFPKDSALALSMVYPTAQATVNEAQAEHAARAVLQDNKVTLTGLVQVPLDNIMLQAVSLGLKVFSDMADSVGKSIKINGEAQALLTDKKVGDYQEQLNKAQEQEKQSKKAKVWAAIFSPITTVIKLIVKPVMDLIKIIPGVETAINWLSKNVSEIALTLAVITSLVCPMTLPLAIGLGITSVAAGFSNAEKYMGDKAPLWLKTTVKVGDMLAGVVTLVSVVGLVGTVSKVFSGMDKVKTFFSSYKIKQMQNIAIGIHGVTSIGDSVTSGVIGTQKAKLDKQIVYLDARLSLNDTFMEWLKSAQTDSVSNLENIIKHSALVSESANQMITGMGSLRARLANSMV